MSELAEAPSIPDSGPISVPSSDEAGPPLTRDEAILRNVSTDLHGNDVEDYVKERRYQEARERGDEEPSRADEAERVKRIQRAARSAAAQDAPSHQPQHQEQQPYAPEQYAEAEDTIQRVRDEARTMAKAEIRRDEYFARNPTAKADMEILNYFPTEEHVAAPLMQSDYLMPILHEMVQNPDLITQANAMSPEQWKQILARAEGIYSERGRLEQMQAYEQQFSPTPRRQTNAPAPLKPLKGGASLGKDPGNMSVSDYVKWRKSQNDD